MAIYYIDKRVAVNGNGTQATPWKAYKEAGSAANVPPNSTVLFIPGSGPYFPSDFTYLSQAKFYPNHNQGGTTIWDLGGNIWTSELDLSSGGEWHESSTDGLYYYTAAGGVSPSIGTVLSGIVDGVWDAQSTSLFGAYPTVTDTTHLKKWGYGDVDSLGFNTVYVRGFDPSEGGHSILMSLQNTPIAFLEAVSNPAFHVIRNGSMRGGGQHAATFTADHRLENIEFVNCDNYGPYITGANPKHYFCTYKQCGHEAFGVSGARNVELYNCHFEEIHVIKKLVSALARTTTVRNCSSKNLLSGAFQHDSATEILVEDHNQFHIDMVNIHGGDALAFTTGTRQWTVTAATDFPASTDTSTTTSVDPLIDAEGRITSPMSMLNHSAAVISGVNDGAQTDPWGNTMLMYPNIGADQYDYAPGFGPWTSFDTTMPPLSLASEVPGEGCEIMQGNEIKMTTKRVALFEGIANEDEVQRALR